MTRAELTDVTPESRAYCEQLSRNAIFSPIFTPFGLDPTVLFPGTNGGANWGGASFDPATHTVYVNSMDVGMLYHMVQRLADAEIPYRPQGSGSPYSRFWDQDLHPCQKPPWAFLTAIDLDRGEFRWRTVLGVDDGLLKRGVPPTGAPNIGGSLVTAGGLVFIGATSDGRFRAFDKDTGSELWTAKLPASGFASPMTFKGSKSGRQFIVIAAGGGNKYSNVFSDALVAFTLAPPSPSPLVSYSRTPASAPASTTAVNAPDSSRAPEIFSHKRHAALGLPCVLCHSGAQQDDRAGFPTASRCMSCHDTTAAIAKLPPTQPVQPPSPIYRLPDFVFFSHARHAIAALTCQACHGNVWSQDPIQSVLPMKMKACVDCHQLRAASLSCTACHELSR